MAVPREKIITAPKAHTDSPCPSESLALFHKEFTDFKEWKQTLKSVHDSSRRCFDKLVATLPNAEEVQGTLISEEDWTALSRVLEKDPTVLLLGLTNCGKSSLANELLGGRILPTAEIPCTSRVVLLEYSENEYIQLRNSDKTVTRKTSLDGGKKRVPRDFIVVSEDERAQREKVKTVVEVGLNNALLQSGVKLVDAPGMSENTTLTEIVRDCVKGVLQLIIYVLDGNNGFRLEDQSVLGSLYDIAPDLSIFYVCNKIETNLSASRMDMASDDEDEDDASENPEEKKLRVFQSLVDYGFINSREKMKDCRFFHGISTREISRERRRGETGKNYSKAFDVMKQDFMFFAGQMLQGHMLHATNSLLQAQIHCFEFFILDALRQGIPNVTKAEELGLMIEELRNNRARLHKNARSALDARKERIGKVIKNAIEGKQDEILLAVQNMKYSPVRVGETVNRNEMVEQLQNQVQRLVVMKITQAVKESLQPEIEALVQEMTKAGDQQLEVLNQTAWEGFRNILTSLTFSLSVPKFSGLLNLTNISWSVARQWMVNDLPSKISAKWKGAVVDTKWRYKIAKETMERLNCKEMTEIVCKEIRSKIDKFFNDLHKEICRIETLNKASKMQEDKSRKVAADIAKELCQTICKTEALIYSCRHGRLVLEPGKMLGQGSRNRVFLMKKWPSLEHKSVSARISKNGEAIGEDVSMLIKINRSLPYHRGILPVLGVALGSVDGLTSTVVITPKIKWNLWTTMADSSLAKQSLSKRLQMGEQIADGCEFLLKHGFPISDLRVTNILVSPKEPNRKNWTLIINMLKPRDDSVLYPDDKLPFHIAPERYGFPKRSRRRSSVTDHKDIQLNGRHLQRSASTDSQLSERRARRSFVDADCGDDPANVYAFGILLWLLVRGTFVRPSYAENTDIDAMNTAVCIEQKRPELDWLEAKSDNLNHKGLADLLKMCWSENSSERPSWTEVSYRLATVRNSISRRSTRVTSV